MLSPAQVMAEGFWSNSSRFNDSVEGILFPSYGRLLNIPGNEYSILGNGELLGYDRNIQYWLLPQGLGYNNDEQTKQYFIFGSNIRLFKPTDVFFDFGNFELSFYGFTYAPSGDLKFGQINDVIEAFSIIEDNYEVLVIDLISRKFFGKDIIPLTENYFYIDDDGIAREVTPDEILRMMGEMWDFYFRMVDVKINGNKISINGSEKMNAANNEYFNLIYEDLKLSNGKRFSFYYSHGFAADFFAHIFADSGLEYNINLKNSSASFETDNNFKMIWNFFIHHDIEFNIKEKDYLSNFRFSYLQTQGMDLRWQFKSPGSARVDYGGLCDLGAGYDLNYFHNYDLLENEGDLFVLSYGRDYRNKDNSLKVELGGLAESGIFSSQLFDQRGKEYDYEDLDERILAWLKGKPYISRQISAGYDTDNEDEDYDFRAYPFGYLGLELNPYSVGMDKSHSLKKMLENFNIQLSGTVADTSLIFIPSFFRGSFDNLFSIDEKNYIDVEYSYVKFFSEYHPYSQHNEYNFAASYIYGEYTTARQIRRLQRKLLAIKDRWGFEDGLTNHEIIKFNAAANGNFFRIGCGFNEEEIYPFLEFKKGAYFTKLKPVFLRYNDEIAGYGGDFILSSPRTLFSLSGFYGVQQNGITSDNFSFQLGFERLLFIGRNDLNFGMFSGFKNGTDGLEEYIGIKFGYYF